MKVNGKWPVFGLLLSTRDLYNYSTYIHTASVMMKTVRVCGIWPEGQCKNKPPDFYSATFTFSV